MPQDEKVTGLSEPRSGQNPKIEVVNNAFVKGTGTGSFTITVTVYEHARPRIIAPTAVAVVEAQTDGYERTFTFTVADV